MSHPLHTGTHQERLKELHLTEHKKLEGEIEKIKALMEQLPTNTQEPSQEPSPANEDKPTE